MLSPTATNEQTDERDGPWHTLGTMCARLPAHPGLWLPASPADLVGSAIEGDGVLLGRRFHERPLFPPAHQPSSTALEGPSGQRALLVFTDDRRARAYARRRGWDPRVSLPSHAVAWLPVLRRVVAEEWCGLVVDRPGIEPFLVSRALAERVCALLQRDRWARLPEWYVLTSNGGIAIERAPSGRFTAWAFDSIENAQRAIDEFLSRDAGMSIASFLTVPLVRDLVEAGIGCLKVNAGLHDEHHYDWSDLNAMVAPHGETEDHATELAALEDQTFATWALSEWNRLEASATLEPAHNVNPDVASTAALSEGTADAPSRGAAPSHSGEQGRRPVVAIPRLARPDDEVRRQVVKFARRFETLYVPQWELTEELAFGFDLWLLRREHAQWPESEGDHVLAYFDGNQATRAASAQPGLVPERLRGLEALRWAWARSDRTSVTLMDLPTGPVRLPATWALGALCPLAYDVRDAAKVPHVGLPRLSSLLGARGLRPEVLRALAQGWRQLLGVRRGDEPLTIECDSVACLAVCTDAEEFFRLASRQAGSRVLPEPFTTPPFERWVRGVAGASGVVINPASTSPICLDSTDLVVLAAWSALGRPPSVDDIVLAAGRLQRAGVLGPTAVGRLVAALPRLVCFGSASAVGMLDGAALVFSSAARANAFLTQLNRGSHGPGGELAFPGGTSLLDVASGWQRALLDHLPDCVSRVLVNPAPSGDCEMSLDRIGVDAARARLAETFGPRVEPFTTAADTWL